MISKRLIPANKLGTRSMRTTTMTHFLNNWLKGPIVCSKETTPLLTKYSLHVSWAGSSLRFLPLESLLRQRVHKSKNSQSITIKTTFGQTCKISEREIISNIPIVQKQYEAAKPVPGEKLAQGHLGAVWEGSPGGAQMEQRNQRRAAYNSRACQKCRLVGPLLPTVPGTLGTGPAICFHKPSR